MWMLLSRSWVPATLVAVCFMQTPTRLMGFQATLPTPPCRRASFLLSSHRLMASTNNHPYTLKSRFGFFQLAATKENMVSNHNILEDGMGHINRELAERIWDWEQEHRKIQNLPKVEYSVRAGLRLVDDLVQECLRERKSGSRIQSPSSSFATLDDHDSLYYSELIQEGLMALLDCMTHYRDDKNEVAIKAQHPHLQHKSHSSNPQHHSRDEATEDFEAYASQQIRSHLKDYLKHDDNVGLSGTGDDESTSAPRQRQRMPKAVRNVVLQARQVIQTWPQQEQQQQQTGKPSLEQVAAALNMPASKLHDYLLLARRVSRANKEPSTRQSSSRRSSRDRGLRRAPPVVVMSVEDTVEIVNPQIQDATRFETVDAWKLQRGYVLDNGVRVNREEDVEDFIDESLALEGDDQAWILQEQIAGPLQDLIADTENPGAVMDDEFFDDDDNDGQILSQPDMEALSDIIRHDLTNFLTSCLTPEQVRVVRLYYGLEDVANSNTSQQQQLQYNAEDLSIAKIAIEMNLTPEQVSNLLTTAVKTLQNSYKARYIEPYQQLQYQQKQQLLQREDLQKSLDRQHFHDDDYPHGDTV